jgi:hypothetical protein
VEVVAIVDVVKGMQVTKALSDDEQDTMTTLNTVIGSRGSVVVVIIMGGALVEEVEDKVGDGGQEFIIGCVW